MNFKTFGRKIFYFGIDKIIKGIRLNSPGKIQSHILGRISPLRRISHNGVDFAFHCPNTTINWRLETFFTKEPMTIEWIDAFKKDDILFDIGANIGLYSTYAAKRGHKVFAFEPDALNYAELNRNIFLNKVGDRVKSLCMTVSNTHCLDSILISNFIAGYSQSSIGPKLQYSDLNYAFQQSVVAYSLDAFLKVFPVDFPTHIKIDVDGAEFKVVEGAKGVLQDDRLKSVLIELDEDLDEDREVFRMMVFNGFRLIKKEYQGSVIHDRVYNYIFRRD